jgi:ubiquinone/menaquinone biosynthesis C-methylase UbiE
MMLLKAGNSRQIYVPIADRLSLNKALEIRTLTTYLELHPGEKVLDVGCGSGYWTRRLADEHECTFVGIDASEEAVACARHHHGGARCSYLLSPAEVLPFEDRSFDKVMSVCALEHFNSDSDALKEMWRVLKPEGVLALSVDSMSGPFATDGYRKWHAQEHFVRNYYDRSSIRAKLLAAGFDLLEHRYLLTSRFTSWAFRFNRRYRFPVVFFIPVLYPLSRLCDIVQGSRDWGLILALRAKRRIKG